MVGPNSQTVILDNMYTSTHAKWETELEDYLHDEYTTWGAIRDNNREDGDGSKVEFSVKYQTYSNVTSNGFESVATVTPEYPNIAIGGSAFYGTYELFPMFPYDTMKANSGPKRKYKLVKSLLDDAGQAIKKNINESCWATSQVNTKFTSLYVAYPTTNNSGSQHGINRGTFSVWQHQSQDCAGLSFTTSAYNNMRVAYSAQCLGAMDDTNKPTHIWSALSVWNLWERVADPKDFVQMSKTGAKGTRTTEAFQFKTCTWLWDRDLTATDRIFQLNMNHIYYYDFSETLPGDPIRAGNGRFSTMEMSVVGQIVCRAPRFQGVIHNFTPT